MRRCQRFAARNRYYLHCDIVKFFPSVDHQIQLSILGRTIKDDRYMEIVRRILASGRRVADTEYEMHYFPGDDLFAALRPRGLPIGNLTSQFWANVYLDQLDHFVKEQLRVKDYLRYADDFVLFSDAKAELTEHRDAMVEFLARLRLTIHCERAVVQPTREGISFLGFRIFPNRVRLKRENVKRFVKRFRSQRKERASGKIATADITRSVQGWIGHAGHAQSAMLREKLLRSLVIK